MADFLFKCPECGRTFTSALMFEWHVDLNSREKYLNTFKKVAENEIQAGRDGGGRLQGMLGAEIEPTIEYFKNVRRNKPDVVEEVIKDKEERRKKLPLRPHDKTGKKK